MNQKRMIVIVLIVLIALTAIFYRLFNTRRDSDIVVGEDVENITITSNAFNHLEAIPDRYTGKGEDISPDLKISHLSEDAVSVAIIMDDLDIPWGGIFTHWTIWNIPAQDVIPEAIPYGASIESLDGTVQGRGYGKNRYRGPNPPFGTHRYQYNVFVVDTMIDLDSSAGKKELLAAMEGHILQYGYIIGCFRMQLNEH